MFRKLRQIFTDVAIGKPRFIVIVARDWYSLEADELAEELKQAEGVPVEVKLITTYEVSNGGEIVDLREVEYTGGVVTITYYEKTYLIDCLDGGELEKRYGYDTETLRKLAYSSFSDEELERLLKFLKLKRAFWELASKTLQLELEED
jgi:hypothetical protein